VNNIELRMNQNASVTGNLQPLEHMPSIYPASCAVIGDAALDAAAEETAQLWARAFNGGRGKFRSDQELIGHFFQGNHSVNALADMASTFTG
jgi:hypothetical protein